MSKKKTKKIIQRFEPGIDEQTREEKKSPFRHITKDLLASVQLFFPSFFIILITAEILKFAYDANVYNLMFPILLVLLGLGTIVFTCLSGFFTKKPYLILPNYYWAFIFIVAGKNYLGYSVSYLIIATLIGIIAFALSSFIIKKDLWIKWIPDPVIKFIPLALGMQLMLFGLMQSGIIRLTPVTDDIKKTFGLAFRGTNAFFPLSVDTFVTPTLILLLLGLGVYIYLKTRNLPSPFFWSLLFIIVLGLIIPAEWGSVRTAGWLSSFKKISFAPQPYRPDIFQMVFSQVFGESGALNLNQWGNFFRILKSNYTLIRLSMMSFFFLVFYSIFIQQSLQQSHQKIHPDTDTKDMSDVAFHRMNAFSSLSGVLLSGMVFTYTEHSVFSLFIKGKTFLTGIFVSLFILLALLIAPGIGYFVNPALIAFIWIVLGAQLLELFFRNITLKHYVDYLVFFPMILITIITMNPVEGLLSGILFYSLYDLAQNFKNKKQAFQPISLVWVGIIAFYYLFKINAF
jgi:xanthine/uracil/vitamin C permease (AzgA family)